MVWKEDNENKTQVSWNIVSSQSKQIHDLMKKATNVYLRGNLGSWYWTLSALRENINYDLSEKQIKVLDNLEKECTSNLSQWNKYKKTVDEGKQDNDLSKSKSLFSSKVREYQRALYSILKDLGYFPNREDKTKLSF